MCIYTVFQCKNLINHWLQHTGLKPAKRNFFRTQHFSGKEVASGIPTLPVRLKTTSFVIIFASLMVVTQVATQKVSAQCKSSGQMKKTGKSETQYFLKVTNKRHILCYV